MITSSRPPSDNDIPFMSLYYNFWVHEKENRKRDVYVYTDKKYPENENGINVINLSEYSEFKWVFVGSYEY